MDDQDQEHLSQIRSVLRRRLKILELREAKMGDNTPPEVIMETEDLREKIQDINSTLSLKEPLMDETISSLIKSGLIKDFNYVEMLDEASPDDKDTPYLDYFYFSSLDVKSGEEVHFLFRVVDEGMNFAGRWDIQFEAGQVVLQPHRVGHGFYKTTVRIFDKLTPSEYPLIVTITDMKDNFSKYNIIINVRNTRRRRGSLKNDR